MKITEREPDPNKVARAGLQLFFNLSKRIGFSPEEERVLLGSPSSYTFELWKTNQSDIVLTEDTLVRISHIMNIYKNLNILLGSEKSASDWFKKPNAEPLFNGGSALDYILDGNVRSLQNVHDYLDAEIHC